MQIEKNKIKFYQKDSIEIVEGEGRVSFPYHTHNCFMLGVITSGITRMKIQNSEYCLGEGMVYIIPSNTGMSMNCITKFSYITICMKEEMAQVMNGYCIQKYIISGIGKLIKDLCEQYKINENEEQFVRSISGILNLKSKEIRNTEKHKSNLIVEQALEYINLHANEKCTIENIAKKLYVSKFYFCRLFKKEMGITPKQYIIQTKLRIVKRRIWEEETETKIAQDMEFAAQSHMCSIFKKYMGVTIREYKNNLTVK